MKKWLAGSLVAVALFAACGDSGDEGDGGAADDTQIAVVGVEFAFTPDAYLVETGSEVKVSFTNEGSVEHNWVLLSTPVEAETEFDEANILFEVGTAAGGFIEGTFTAPAPGDYQVICDIPGHFSAGMVGDLTVTE